MTTTSLQDTLRPRPENDALERRLDEAGWGLFLLMTGMLWLLPEGRVPSGTWLAGTGILLLALNAVRYAKGAEIHLMTAMLGALTLAGGIAEMTGLTLPLFALALVAGGVLLLAMPFVRSKR